MDIKLEYVAICTTSCSALSGRASGILILSRHRYCANPINAQMSESKQSLTWGKTIKTSRIKHKKNTNSHRAINIWPEASIKWWFITSQTISTTTASTTCFSSPHVIFVHHDLLCKHIIVMELTPSPGRNKWWQMLSGCIIRSYLMVSMFFLRCWKEALRRSDLSICNWKHMKCNYVVSLR